MTDAVTLDWFLNGRITVAQPKNGFRAGHDSVLLAASVPAEPGSRIVELGSGAGVASLCLAARVSDVVILGVEIDFDLVRLANENALRNNVADRVSFTVGDASHVSFFPPPRAGEVSCRDGGGLLDHVFFNPPFHPDSAHMSLHASRDRAMRDSTDAVRTWTARALSLVKDGGTVTAIVRADRVDDILNVAHDHRGIVFPLFPRIGVDPKRAIVQITKVNPRGLPSPLLSAEARRAKADEGEGGAKRRKGGDTQNVQFITAAGLVLHESNGRNTPAAEDILRHGQALNLAP